MAGPRPLHQREDLLVGVDERRPAVPAQPDQPGRRDLGPRVDPGEIAREPADDEQPHRRHDTPSRHDRLHRPSERQVDRHDLGADRVEVGGELGQQAGVLLELEPERASQPQVVIDMLSERGHRIAPGHGEAARRSRCEVDLGVDRGALQVLVAQHLADVDHRRALAQQIARERVPQPVRWHLLDARPAAGVADDRSHPARLKRPNRRMHRQEHAPLPALAAAMLQMLDDRLADVAGQRELVAPVGLAVDDDLARRANRDRRAAAARLRPRAIPAVRAAAGPRSRARRSRRGGHRRRAAGRSPVASGTAGSSPRASARPGAPHRASPGSAKPRTAR